MKTLNKLLAEKRRNPSQNKKSSSYEVLKKYAKRNDIFVTYTKLNKVGINPQNDFNTPTAVYAYPLPQVWKTIEYNKDAQIVPFAGERRYIQVIKPSGNGVFVHDLKTKYSKAMYDKDMEYLRKTYGDPKEKKLGDNRREKYIKAYLTFADKISWLHTAMKKLIAYDDDQTNMDNTIQSIKNISKDISWTIKKYPDNFKVGLNTDIREMMNDQIEYLYNIRDYLVIENELDKLADKDKFRDVMKAVIQSMGTATVLYAQISLKGGSEHDVEWSIQQGADGARDKSWGGKFWNTTRLVSNGNSESGSKSAVALWNKILRELGYSGFADRSGAGIIHPAEPTQAIFLSIKGIKHLETIDNINPSKTVDIKTMQDYFDQYDSITKGMMLDLEDISYPIQNRSILPKNRKSFNKIVHKYIVDNADKMMEVNFDNVSAIGAYMLYNNLWNKISKKNQNRALSRLTVIYSNPLLVWRRFGMKMNNKVLMVKIAEQLNIPKKEWKNIKNYTYGMDVLAYAKEKGYYETT